MTIPATESLFDVAEWFLDTALNDREYLQPMKMQYLLFLSQGYYCAITKGGLLIPSIFIATAQGPIEPNSYRLYGVARPNITRLPMPPPVSSFLQTIWRRFGAYSADYLYRLISTHAPYAESFAKGEKTIIPLADLQTFYSQNTNSSNTPCANTMTGTRVMRSQSGKTVAVKKWLPLTEKKK